MEGAHLDLFPSDPIASSDIPGHPGLIQWLALADQKQCTALVEACLDKLLVPPKANACKDSGVATIPIANLREALFSPCLGRMVSSSSTSTRVVYISTAVALHVIVWNDCVGRVGMDDYQVLLYVWSQAFDSLSALFWIHAPSPSS